MNIEAEQKAAEIRIRAERRAGQLLKVLERGKTGPKELVRSTRNNSKYAAGPGRGKKISHDTKSLSEYADAKTTFREQKRRTRTMVNIDHLLDPSRPGFLKPQVLLKPGEFLEAGRRGLRSATGKSFKFSETSIDPLSAKALRPSAPAELHKAVDDTKARYRDAQALTDAAYEKWRQAIASRAQFSSATIGSPLTAAGGIEANRLDRSINDADKNYRSAEDIEQQARGEYFRAQIAMQVWVNNERLRLQESARLAAELAKKPKVLPLGERLAKLKNKIAG